jgi:hypothetical protein
VTSSPGLLRYQTPEQAAASFGDLERAFARDRTLAETYVELATFTAKLRCGHTYPNFYNQSEAVASALFASRPRVPFQFRWLSGEMVVTRSFAGDAPRLLAGSVVTALDGVPSSEIRARLLPLVRADGGNDAARLRQLEVQGRDRYEAFDIYFPLIFPTASPTFRLTFRPPGASVEESLVVRWASDEDRRVAFEDDAPRACGLCPTSGRRRPSLTSPPRRPNRSSGPSGIRPITSIGPGPKRSRCPTCGPA